MPWRLGDGTWSAYFGSLPLRDSRASNLGYLRETVEGRDGQGWRLKFPPRQSW